MIQQAVRLSAGDFSGNNSRPNVSES